MRIAKELDEYSAEEVFDDLVSNVEMDYDCTRQQAEQLVLNALSYSAVSNAIYTKIAQLVEG